jgi:hypothetical protein
MPNTLMRRWSERDMEGRIANAEQTGGSVR